MRSRLAAALICLAALGAGGYLLIHRAPRPGSLAVRDARTPAAKSAANERLKADALYGSRPAEAEARYRAFVGAHRADKDPAVQDQVGEARIRLGYLAAKRKDFAGARAVFLQAAAQYRGTGKVGEDFGGIPDQAAYQAAVTLVAEGKKDEAKQAFVRFMRERPLSPLVHAAHGRLARLQGGSTTPGQDALLQSAVDKQQARIRFETSVCGPKAIAYVLPLLGKAARGYKEIAGLCGTTGDGTTLEGMRKGLKALGVETYPLDLNRPDFSKLKAPALLLEQGHYLVITSVGPERAEVYDSRFGSSREMRLPALTDTSFHAVVLAFSLPELGN